MKINYKFIARGCLLFLLTFSCTESFLEYPPYGSVSEITLSTKAGVEGILIGAYSLLDQGGATGASWQSARSNFTCGDEFNRGTEFGASDIGCFLIDQSH